MIDTHLYELLAKMNVQYTACEEVFEWYKFYYSF